MPFVAALILMSATGHSKTFESLLKEHWTWIWMVPSPLAMYLTIRLWNSHQRRKRLSAEMFSGVEWTPDFSVYSGLD
jgi:hypothetical protein